MVDDASYTFAAYARIDATARRISELLSEAARCLVTLGDLSALQVESPEPLAGHSYVVRIHSRTKGGEEISSILCRVSAYGSLEASFWAHLGDDGTAADEIEMTFDPRSDPSEVAARGLAAICSDAENPASRMLASAFEVNRAAVQPKLIPPVHEMM